MILATPVAAAESIQALRSDAAEIICLEAPEGFYAVSQFYRDFHQTTDEEVKAILREKQSAETQPSSARG